MGCFSTIGSVIIGVFRRFGGLSTVGWHVQIGSSVSVHSLGSVLILRALSLRALGIRRFAVSALGTIGALSRVLRVLGIGRFGALSRPHIIRRFASVLSRALSGALRFPM